MPSWAMQYGVQSSNPITFGGIFTTACPTWIIHICAFGTTPANGGGTESGGGTTAPSTGGATTTTGGGTSNTGSGGGNMSTGSGTTTTGGGSSSTGGGTSSGSTPDKIYVNQGCFSLTGNCTK